MSYAPSSRSYWDGIEKGTRTERARILALIMSEKHFLSSDMYDTAVIAKFTDLLLAINNEAQCTECKEIVALDDIREVGVCYVCDKWEEGTDNEN